MPLPSFPGGINTQLPAPPQRSRPPKKLKLARRSNPRAVFVMLFIVAMIVVALYPFLHALHAP
ncbi:MAG: hypothetical protein NVS1B14_06820 [Vulcanimicrobiaceae bacterium]